MVINSAMAKQIPLTCSGHTRPVVDLAFSRLTDDGYFMISACKGEFMISEVVTVSVFRKVFFSLIVLQCIRHRMWCQYIGKFVLLRQSQCIKGLPIDFNLRRVSNFLL